MNIDKDIVKIITTSIKTVHSCENNFNKVVMKSVHITAKQCLKSSFLKTYIVVQ